MFNIEEWLDRLFKSKKTLLINNGYQTEKERIKEYQRKYKKEYRETNKALIKQYAKEYYQNNKETIKAQVSNYYQAHKQLKNILP